MFVIPMAGLSSRFFKAGYDLPKYQLELPSGDNMFKWSLKSFKNYFSSDLFVFVVRDVYETISFVGKCATELGILNFEIVILDRETIGQAETVYLGIENSVKAKKSLDESLYVFNIDSCRHNFEKPDWVESCDGYLEVFKGVGDHWSFVQISDNKVVKTTEKERISDLCSNGLYYFKTIADYQKLTEYYIENKYFVHGELYIAPMYNYLINAGLDIRVNLIDQNQIEFCGTPDEYRDICNKTNGKNKV